METFIIYALKASGVIALFYLVYELLLKKETFFVTNRLFLLTGLLMAFILPLVVIPQTLEYAAFSPTLTIDNALIVGTAAESNAFDWRSLLQLVFLAGFALMLGRLIIQLLSVYKLIRSNKVFRLGKYRMVEMQENVAPFSFFNYIFYNPHNYDQRELKAIMEHEKVHCEQLHSVDILWTKCLLLISWFSPLSWFYLGAIRQNLEFLADAGASQRIPSRKDYQYTMLKVAGNFKVIPVTNTFYNSLIKKRIVMLHQSKSKNRNVLKMLIVLPLLALFLWSFNTETVYVPVEGDAFNTAVSQKIDIEIDKDTSDEELEAIKKDLSEKGIDFSYTVVHNESKEIIDLELTLTRNSDDGNTFTGTSAFQNDGKPIDPVIIVLDEDNNFLFMDSQGDKTKIVRSEKNISTWVHSDGDAHQSIEIYKDDGKEVIKVNGKKISRKELKRMEKDGELHGGRIIIDSDKKGKRKTVIIRSDDDGEHMEHDHEIEVISGSQGGFIFMNGEFDEDWYVLLDGKEVPFSMVRDLDPDDVQSINVIKGEAAVKKYGKKAREGALEISTRD